MTRTILVTGAASGIGKATADLLRMRGDKVIGLDLRDADILADLSTIEGRRSGVERAISLSGGTLDGVVACAGIAGGATDAVIAINYFGTIAIIQGLRDTLAAAATPRVAVISSGACIMPAHQPIVDACLAGDEAMAKAAAAGMDGLTYPSTKQALSRWVRQNAILPQWAGQGIFMNAISPGIVVTPMTEPMFETEKGRELIATAPPIAVADYASADDIAPLLAFLVSADCRYMVGTNIFIDGGGEIMFRGEAKL